MVRPSSSFVVREASFVSSQNRLRYVYEIRFTDRWAIRERRWRTFSSSYWPAFSNRRDLVGLRKDGMEFPLTIHLTQLTTAGGVYVMAFTCDTHNSA